MKQELLLLPLVLLHLLLNSIGRRLLAKVVAKLMQLTGLVLVTIQEALLLLLLLLLISLNLADQPLLLNQQLLVMMVVVLLLLLLHQRRTIGINLFNCTCGAHMLLELLLLRVRAVQQRQR